MFYLTFLYFSQKYKIKFENFQLNQAGPKLIHTSKNMKKKEKKNHD